MLEIKPSIARGWGTGELYPILRQLQDFSMGHQGTVYFVEKNSGSDGYDGLSWDKPFKTIVYAIAVCNANIGRGPQGWQSRNTIFIKGDFTETLDIFPQKTDIIGCGSTNHMSMARIIGTHAPTDTVWGVRFFNVWFQTTTATIIITFESGGFEMHNCWFKAYADGATTATHAMTIDRPIDVLIQGCRFTPNLQTPFSTAAIAITEGTGATDNCRIIGNDIYGATGIHITAPVGSYSGCLIKDNFIHATTFTIDDDSNQWDVVDNRLISDAAESSAIDANADLAVGNILTTTDDCRSWPFVTIT
jgi:hypothetical protein